MRIKTTHFALLLFLLSIQMSGQQISEPEPQAASIIGTIEDVNGGTVPGATVIADGAISSDRQIVTANEDGFFSLGNLRPSVTYHIAIHADGFQDWTSSATILTPGQLMNLTIIKLTLAEVTTTVNAITQEQLAGEQVHAEEKQRVLGLIPNFYVVYDKNAVPLTKKLKFELAFKSASDPATIAGMALLAGVYQASDTPNYVEGLKGYGQRFGAVGADGFSDIMIGGAILPSLLHQDPRYFYQGTGTKTSRALHAISAPFVAKGDNGQWQFNYSSVGGDLASGALSNLYYPASNRGASLVFTGALITTGGRIANALAQEFLLHRITSRAKDPD
jgi:hypothetical protein